MKERFPIYFDQASIYKLADIHSENFKRIFLNRAKVYLDMSQAEIDDIEDVKDGTMTSAVRLFFSEMDVTPYSGKTDFEELYKRETSLSKFNGCVFFLDITKEEAKALSQDSGIWVLSKDEIDNDAECLVLEEGIKMDEEDVIPNKEYFCNDKNGWKALFEGRERKFPPYNEIVLYDNFIKEYDGKYRKIPPYCKKKIKGESFPYTYIGLENLLLLLQTILPDRHNCEISILIALPKYPKVDHEEKLEKRIKIWINEVKQLRTYKLNVSCLLIGSVKWQNETKESHPLHPRVLYTNYFSIKTEKGFKLFEPYPYSNIVRTDGESKNNISVSSFFSNPKIRNNPIKANYNSKLEDIGNQLKAINYENVSHDNTLIGDNVSIDKFALFDEIDFE